MPVHLICLYEEHQQRRQKHQKHEGAGRSSGSKGYLAFSKLLTRCIRLVHQAALPRKSQNDVPTPLSLTSSYSRFPWRCHLAKSWIPASSSRNISPAYLMLYVQVGDTERSLHPPPGYFCMHPRSLSPTERAGQAPGKENQAPDESCEDEYAKPVEAPCFWHPTANP